MNLEVALLAKAWLQHPVYGVNALLPNVPRVATHRVPREVTVYADLDDEVYVEGIVTPPSRPAVLVLVDAAPTEELDAYKPALVAQTFQLAVIYVSDDEAAVIGRRDGSYTARAIRQSLIRWMQHGTETDRKLNAVKVVKVSRATLLVIGDEKMHLWGGVIATIVAQDEAP